MQISPCLYSYFDPIWQYFGPMNVFKKDQNSIWTNLDKIVDVTTLEQLHHKFQPSSLSIIILVFTGNVNTEWQCQSGKCIDKTYICDYYDDCDDRSDETSCLCKPLFCCNRGFAWRGTHLYSQILPHPLVSFLYSTVQKNNKICCYFWFTSHQNFKFQPSMLIFLWHTCCLVL